MIVEKSAFEIAAFPQALAGHSTTSTTRGIGQGRGRGRGHGTVSLGRGQGRTTAVKQGLEYAAAHGQKRGMFGGEHDISKTPSVWHVWHQTSQTLPVFHITSGDISTLAMP